MSQILTGLPKDIISPYNPSPTYPSSMKPATAQQNSTTITEPAVQIRENLQTVMLILLMFLMRRNKLCYKSHSNICDLYCINNSTNWCLQNWQIANAGCTFLSVNFIRTNWIEDLRTTQQQCVDSQKQDSTCNENIHYAMLSSRASLLPDLM